MNPGLIRFCSVGENRDLCLRGDLPPELHCCLNGLGEFGSRSRLAVSGKRDDVRKRALFSHFQQFLFERFGNEPSRVVAIRAPSLGI